MVAGLTSSYPKAPIQGMLPSRNRNMRFSGFLHNDFNLFFSTFELRHKGMFRANSFA